VAEAGEFGEWLRRRPNGAGAQLTRRRRWLERQPGFSMEILTAESEIAAALPTLWRLHHARWAGKGGSHAVDGPLVERFHAAAARALARRGWARLYLLHVEGAPRAALYGFERGGRFAYYQLGYDPAWRQRSVGTVVLGAAIEDAFHRGLAEFDFLRGDEAYKHLFASSHRQLMQVRLATGARAQAEGAVSEAQGAARRLALRVLPLPVVRLVRRWRRARRWTAAP
jgi:CelD/BcsL family acetyltransferase involved in cellulose biosynthesis